MCGASVRCHGAASPRHVRPVPCVSCGCRRPTACLVGNAEVPAAAPPLSLHSPLCSQQTGIPSALQHCFWQAALRWHEQVGHRQAHRGRGDQTNVCPMYCRHTEAPAAGGAVYVSTQKHFCNKAPSPLGHPWMAVQHWNAVGIRQHNRALSPKQHACICSTCDALAP